MSTLAEVNETLVDIKGAVARQTSILGNKLEGGGAKPAIDNSLVPPSGPKDLTAREKKGTTSAEAAREGLKERAGDKPKGAGGLGGLAAKAPNLPVTTGNKLLDYGALAALGLAFTKEIADFLKGFLGGLKEAFQKEIDAFKNAASEFIDENITSLVTGAAIGLQTTFKRLQASTKGIITGTKNFIAKSIAGTKNFLAKTMAGISKLIPGMGAKPGLDDVDKPTKPKVDDPDKPKKTAKPNTRESLIKETKKLTPRQLARSGLEPAKGGGYTDKATKTQATNQKLAQATQKTPSPSKVPNLFSPSQAMPKAKVPASGGGGPGQARPASTPMSKPSAIKQVAKQSKMILKMLAKVKALKAITKAIPVIGTILGPVFAAIESAEVLQDPKKTDEEKRAEITNIIAGLVTGTVAAIFGAIIGAAVLSVIPIAGTFVGGLIGGALAYVAGDAVGRGLIGPQVADYLFDGKPVDKNSILAGLSSFMESDEGKKAKTSAAKSGPGAPGSKPMAGGPGVDAMSAPMDGAKPSPGAAGAAGAGATATPGKAGAAGAGAAGTYGSAGAPGTSSGRSAGGPGQAKAASMQKVSGGPGVDPMSASVDGPSVSAAEGTATSGQRIAAAATTQKAAMVNQAARQEAAASGGNNITINKAGDTQINQDGGGGGTTAPVVVVKSDGDMPRIGAKIAYGMGL